MSKPVFQPLSSYIEYPIVEMRRRATEFREHMQRRRTVRQFAERPVPQEVIEECLRTAGSAPNGANLQPWHFVVVSDPKVKREIRIAAEQEEEEFYGRRAPQEIDGKVRLGSRLVHAFAVEKPVVEDGDDRLRFVRQPPVDVDRSSHVGPDPISARARGGPAKC